MTSDDNGEGKREIAWEHEQGGGGWLKEVNYVEDIIVEWPLCYTDTQL